jgi:ferric-dicitrate binding protein FerR (iron transport regulator)
MGPYDWTVNRKASKEVRPCKVFLLSALVFIGLFVYPAEGALAACEEWVAKAVSVQGPVEVRRAGEAEWVSVRLDDAFRSGDMIRVKERGRAAFFLCNETVLRLDQKTAITFTGLEEERTTLLDLLRGAVHFFSRIPRSLKVATPFVNGAVEGTEFYVRVSEDATFLSVFEGRVLATNEAGSTIVISGHATLTRQGETPVSRAALRP